MDTTPIGSGPRLLHYDLILTNDICSDAISKKGHALKYWGSGAGRVNLGMGRHGSTPTPIKTESGGETAPHNEMRVPPPEEGRMGSCTVAPVAA